MPVESLQKQLERIRFERALEVVESMATHKVLLTTAELGRINSIMTGREPEGGPWREGTVSLMLPSGKTESISLVGDPKVTTREKLHRATELSEAGQVVDGAVLIYVELVKLHPFTDANRRTAVLAAHYFLNRYGVPLSGLALHEMGLGDVRDPAQVEALRETLKNMAKFAARRKD